MYHSGNLMKNYMYKTVCVYNCSVPSIPMWSIRENVKIRVIDNQKSKRTVFLSNRHNTSIRRN